VGSNQPKNGWDVVQLEMIPPDLCQNMQRAKHLTELSNNVIVRRRNAVSHRDRPFSSKPFAPVTGRKHPCHEESRVNEIKVKRARASAFLLAREVGRG